MPTKKEDMKLIFGDRIVDMAKIQSGKIELPDGARGL